jgi:hypothetical protein
MFSRKNFVQFISRKDAKPQSIKPFSLRLSVFARKKNSFNDIIQPLRLNNNETVK